MGIFNQRVTNPAQTPAQNRFSNTGTVSGTSANNTSRIQSYSQGMNFARGQMIRGEIIDLRNHEVKIQLNGDRILSGRIGDPAGLAIGESATFQVMEANPSNVELKLVSNQRLHSEEATIDKALEAAGLPKSERNVSVVRELLSQGLSVDKNSIQLLLRQSAMFRGVSFHTLALMNKLHIPATQVNASQMEAYLNYEHRIMNLAEQAAQEVADAIALTAGSSEQAAAALNQDILTLLTAPQDAFSALLTAAQPADAPLSSFALLSADGTLALMDALEPFGLTQADAAAIVNGTATLRQTASLILSAADRCITAGQSGIPDSSITGTSGMTGSSITGTSSMTDSSITGASGMTDPSITGASGMANSSVKTGSPVTADSSMADSSAIQNSSNNTGAISLFRSLIQSAGSIFGSQQSVTTSAENVTNAPVNALNSALPNGMPQSAIPQNGILQNGISQNGFLQNNIPQNGLDILQNIQEDVSAKLPVLPGQMILADAINNLPVLLQTPEIYAILGEYASLAGNSLELSSFLPKEQRLELSSQLKGKLPNTVLKKLEDGELTAAELLKLLLEQSKNSPNQDSSYLSSKAYQEILRQMLLNRFSIKPQDLQDKDSIPKYYEALDRDLSVLEKMQSRSITQASFQDTAANIRDNIDFMKTLNQMFPYLQLPMKFSNQNAHAELYVYTKKEQLLRDPSSVSVLLHLDMEQLGSVDIHLSLEKRNLQARFYLPDPISAAVTRENFSLLQRSLSVKGYTLDARAEERRANTSLPHDLLAPEKENNSMKRYTFDIRA